MQIHQRRFLNNFKTQLTASWGTSGGASLPTIPSGDMTKLLNATTNGQHLMATLSNADGSVIEIIRLIRGASVFTSERGREGTTAVSWASGSNLSVRLTAGTLNRIIGDLSILPLVELTDIRYVGFYDKNIASIDIDTIVTSDDWFKAFYVGVGLNSGEIWITNTTTDIFAEIYVIVNFTGSYTVPIIKLNGTTKTPFGTAPTSGVDYTIKITVMGAAGIRLEYLPKS